MEIFISKLTGSAYILDDKGNLMFRPLSKNDECFKLDIGDFDYVEFEELEDEVLDNGLKLVPYLDGVAKQLKEERDKNGI